MPALNMVVTAFAMTRWAFSGDAPSDKVHIGHCEAEEQAAVRAKADDEPQ